MPAYLGDILLVINRADLGDTIYLGYTANYAAYVYYGARGNAPRPWVTMVAQRWTAIVADEAADAISIWTLVKKPLARPIIPRSKLRSKQPGLLHRQTCRSGGGRMRVGAQGSE